LANLNNYRELLYKIYILVTYLLRRHCGKFYCIVYRIDKITMLLVMRP